MSLIRQPKVVRALIVAIPGLWCAVPVLAQAERGTMVQDDGTTRRVLHFSMPDFEVLRRPAYTHPDLPVFNEILALSEPQAALTGDALDDYLEAFRQLALRPLSMDEAAEAADGPGDAPRRGSGPGGNEWINDVIGEEMERAGFDPGTRDDFDMGIEISMGNPDPEAGGPPQVQVGVSMTGDDLDEETQEKLQQIADAASKRIQERISESMAEGRNPFGAPVGPGGDMARDHMAERQADLESMRERVREYRKEANRLRIAFENNVKGLLSESQAEEWPALERALVRIRTLPQGRLDGERTDLIGILKGMDLTAANEQAVAEHVETFELLLHDALTRRNQGVDDIDFKIDEALAEGDGRAAVREAQKATRLHTAVRDLNDSYTDIFADALSDDVAGEFRDKAMKQGYPRAYERTVAARAFEEALASATLTNEQRATIREMYDAYQLQVKSFNDAIRHAIRTHEPGQLPSEIERVVAVIEGDGDRPDHADPDEPIDRAEGRRRTLDRQSMMSLYSLLPHERVASLPKVPQRRAGDPITVEGTASSGGQ